MSQGLRLMAVHAHPDDESSKGAATMARYVAEGADVLVVSCTGGERGDILNEKLKDDPEVTRDIAETRRREMARAAQILGVRHVWLGFVDSGLPEGEPLPPLPEGCFALEPVEVAAEALVRVIREFRPHVLTTYDEQGGYPHPDHVRTHVVTMAAFEAAGDPAAYPHAGPPWQPQKLYYNGWSLRRVTRLHEAMVERGLPSPFADWVKGLRRRPERAVHTHIHAAPWFPVRDDALRAHATQVDPDGFWFQVPRDLEAEVYPTEDYELAVSLVPVELPEDDLFAGLRELDLEMVCRAMPERDASGALVACYRSPLPPPVDVDGDGIPDEPEPGDYGDEVTEQEGHRDTDSDAVSGDAVPEAAS